MTVFFSIHNLCNCKKGNESPSWYEKKQDSFLYKFDIKFFLYTVIQFNLLETNVVKFYFHFNQTNIYLLRDLLLDYIDLISPFTTTLKKP